MEEVDRLFNALLAAIKAKQAGDGGAIFQVDDRCCWMASRLLNQVYGNEE